MLGWYMISIQGHSYKEGGLLSCVAVQLSTLNILNMVGLKRKEMYP